MKLHFKSVMIGLLTGILYVGALPVLATQGTKSISVMFNNIKLTLNQQAVQFKDSSGKAIEPFIYEGNTYVPIESLAQSLNLFLTTNPAGNVLALSSTATVASTTPINEFESNNTVASANVIQPTSTIIGNVGSKDSSGSTDHTDWFKVTVPSTGTFHLGLSCGPDQYLYLSLYGQDGDKTITFAEGEDTKLSISQPLEAGVYYIKVNTPPSASSQPYRLSTSLTPISTPNDKGINETKDQSSVYKLGQKNTGNLGYYAPTGIQDTEDWYSFNVPSNKKVKLSLAPNSTLNLRATLYDNTGKSILLDVRGQNETINLEKFLVKGTYYLKLKVVSGAGTYTLSSK